MRAVALLAALAVCMCADGARAEGAFESYLGSAAHQAVANGPGLTMALPNTTAWTTATGPLVTQACGAGATTAVLLPPGHPDLIVVIKASPACVMGLARSNGAVRWTTPLNLPDTRSTSFAADPSSAHPSSAHPSSAHPSSAHPSPDVDTDPTAGSPALVGPGHSIVAVPWSFHSVPRVTGLHVADGSLAWEYAPPFPVKEGPVVDPAVECVPGPASRGGDMLLFCALGWSRPGVSTVNLNYTLVALDGTTGRAVNDVLVSSQLRGYIEAPAVSGDVLVMSGSWTNPLNQGVLSAGLWALNVSQIATHGAELMWHTTSPGWIPRHDIAIAADTVFSVVKYDSATLRLPALDLFTGKLKWEAVVSAGSGVPALDASAGILVLAETVGVTALDPGTGTVVWTTPDAAAVSLIGSPSIDTRTQVVVVVDRLRNATLLMVDAATGAVGGRLALVPGGGLGVFDGLLAPVLDTRPGSPINILWATQNAVYGLAAATRGPSPSATPSPDDNPPVLAIALSVTAAVIVFVGVGVGVGIFLVRRARTQSTTNAADAPDAAHAIDAQLGNEADPLLA